MKNKIHFLTLKFSDEQLEKEFVLKFNKEHIFQTRFGILLAMSLFIFYALVDPYAHPNSYKSLWIIRFVIVSLLIFLFLTTYHPKYIQNVQLHNSIGLFLTGIGLLALYSYPVETIYAYIFFGSFLLYIAGTFVMVGLIFFNALVIVLLLNVFVTVMIFVQLDTVSTLIFFFFFLSLTIAQAQGSYFSELAERKLFLKEKTLQEKQAIMFQQSKLASMGEMIGNIAHQWRQPLNTLSLLIQKIGIFYQRGLLDEKTLTKELHKSRGIINGMSSTIDDFRDFFKPNKEKSDFLIEEAINKAYLIIKPNLENNNISYQLKIKPNGLKIHGYMNEFSQVMINLFNNSKDALIERKILDATIWVNVFEEKGVVYIDTCDNAGGIDSDVIDRIFEPYFTTKEEGKGTGIGLYMSKNIIQSHMLGSLSAYNKDKGSCLRIELPTAAFQ